MTVPGAPHRHRRPQSLEHPNVAVVYGPRDVHHRGTVSFNLVGTLMDEGIEAAAAQIRIGTGCFCDPGAAEGVDARTLRPPMHAKVHGQVCALPYSCPTWCQPGGIG